MNNTDMQNAEMQKSEMTESTSANAQETTEKEILVVTSKMKNYIRTRSGMNTSGSVSEILSDRVRALCDQAIENARSAGRKTVMDRDFT